MDHLQESPLQIDKGWVEEKVQDSYAMRYRVEKTPLYSKKSSFQWVDVVETQSHGTLLFNDGLAMVSDRDEFIYHEMMAHVPLFVHPNPKKVLIIGGGDGGTAREVLRHSSVQSCKMVEIDSLVVEACCLHFPKISKILLDPPPQFDLIIDDGVEFLKKTQDQFDVILIDSTDPIGPATPLFGHDFYQTVYDHLNEDGIVVAQGESPFYFEESQKSLLGILNAFFPITTLYNFTNMTYPGGLWSFMLGSKKYHPLRDLNKERVLSSGLDFDYYNVELHEGCFALPSFMKKKLGFLIKGMD